MNKIKNWFINLSISSKELLLIAVLSFFLILVGLSGIYFAERANEIARIIIPVIVLLSLLSALTLGLLLSRLITEPVISLKEKMARVARREFDIEPAEVVSKDEIGQLNASFNVMAENLKNIVEREAILRKIISTIRNTLNINDIEQAIVNEVGRAFNADRCFFRIYDANTDKFLPVHTEYISSPDVSGIIGAIFEETRYGGFKERYKHKEIHVMPDLEACINEPNMDITGIRALIDDYNVKSNYGFSIFYEDRFLGVFVIHYTKNKVTLDDDSIELLKSVADQSGIALNQAQLYETTKKNAEMSGAIKRIIESIGGSLDLNIVLTSVLKEILVLFNADRVVAGTYPKPGDYSGWVATWDIKARSEYPDFTGDPKLWDKTRQWIGENLVGKGQNLVIDNINDPSVPDFYKEEHRSIWTKSILNVPIKKGNEVWGALAICQIDYYRKWTDEDITLLQQIADQAFIAIRQAEFYSNAQKAAERESLLRAINNQILGSRDINEAVNAIVSEIGKIFDVDRVVLRFYEPAIKSFSEVKGEYRRDKSVPTAFGKPPYSKETNEYFIKEAAEKKQILPIENVETPQYPEYLKHTFNYLNIKSTLLAPILYGDTILGLIFLTETSKHRSWSQKDIELLQDIVYQISIGIHLFDLADKLGKSLNSERAVRDIIFEARGQEKHDVVFNYMLRKLVETFRVERALHLHYDKHCNLRVANEELIKPEFGSICNQPVLMAEHTKELMPKVSQEAIIVNDIETEIKDAQFKDYLKNKNILSFMVYPVAKQVSVEEIKKFLSTVMLCSSKPRIWTQNEIDSFKLTVDTTSIVYLEMKQRKETEQTRNTFLATLTHDLRSPISGEQKALEFILSRKDETQLGDFREFLDDIYRTNEELLRIVNNILAVYHYESGQFVLNLEPNNINEIIEDSIRAMMPLAKAEQSDISVNVQDDLPEIILDRDEIRRVITNLISNAIKHTRKGTAIKVTAQKTDNCIKVAVCDNGPGIQEEEKQMIFQRYPTAKRKVGTGLGLYISKQIIDAHQGKIWFETEVGKGTTFCFTLPIVKK